MNEPNRSSASECGQFNHDFEATKARAEEIWQDLIKSRKDSDWWLSTLLIAEIGRLRDEFRRVRALQEIGVDSGIAVGAVTTRPTRDPIYDGDTYPLDDISIEIEARKGSPGFSWCVRLKGYPYPLEIYMPNSADELFKQLSKFFANHKTGGMGNTS